jgi:hypothetical protein
LWIVREPKIHKPAPVVQPDRRPTAIRPPSVTTKENASTSPESATEHLAMPDATDTQPTPHLDLDAMRAQAVQQELGREKSPIELHNEASKRNNSLEAQVEDGTNKAQRSDCRTAHAGAGLFAPLMIAADLIRDKGCKF